MPVLQIQSLVRAWTRGNQLVFLTSMFLSLSFFLPSPLYKYIYILLFFMFLEGKGGRKRGRETSMCKRNINRSPLACPQVGTWPTTQACALTGNWTSDPSVCRRVLNLLSHISQACFSKFSKTKLFNHHLFRPLVLSVQLPLLHTLPHLGQHQGGCSYSWNLDKQKLSCRYI